MSSPRSLLRRALIAALSLVPLLATPPTARAAEEVKLFDPSRHSQQVTECDRLASHPDDPFRVAPGLDREQIDLLKAIEACQRAVKEDPTNPRLNYQLGRTLGYSGRGAEGLANRAMAVEGNYPQALFVIGFMSLYGINQQPKDACYAGDLLRRSAQQGRLAGQLGFPRYVLMGMFASCSVKQDREEMLGFVAAARKQIGGDYYQGLLADMLEEDLRVFSQR